MWLESREFCGDEMCWTRLWSFADCGLSSLTLLGNVDDCGLEDVDEGYAIHGVRCSHYCEGAGDEELEGRATMKRL